MRKAGFLLLLFLPLALEADESDWEPVYHRGELVEEILTNDEGRTIGMKSYRNEKLLEEATYLYETDRIIISTKRISSEESGSEWIDTLYLRSDGSLRKMVRTGDYNPFLIGWSQYNYWNISETRTEITSFDERGEKLGRIILSEREPVEEEFFLYSQDGFLKSSEWHRYPLDEVEISDYDRNKQIVEVRLYRHDLLVSETGFTYNADGRLIKRITLGEGQTESWTSRYDKDGRISEEKFYKNGILSRIITYDDERVDEIYNKGKLTLRINYRGDELISEENFD